MKLSKISISYFRSITDAYKIDLDNLTVLIGKNNEGKTNVIKAILLAMNVLQEIDLYGRRRIVSKRLYDWNEDFPISLQNSKKLKNKSTKIRLDFLLTDQESRELSEKINSNINNEISIYIEINNNNTLSVTVPKKGKNASAITNKIVDISHFIRNHFDLQYIPAIRSQNEAYHVLNKLVSEELKNIDDQVYKDSLEYIEKKQNEHLKILANKVIKPFKTFLPAVKSVDIYFGDTPYKSNYMPRKTLNIDIDDGVSTSLSNKGDGVKSLAAIALLSQISTSNSRLIIVDEPENHLHPDAIRFINGVLNNLSIQDQVLISSHSPIFVNRNIISANIIVESGYARKADKIDSIRKTLGVLCSDNLMYSDYVVVVEGPTDRMIMTTLLSKDEEIKKFFANNIITVRATGGTNNLPSEIYSLQRYCCNFLIILDYDNAGKDVANRIKNDLSVSNNNIRYFMRSNNSTEIEDLYEPNLYSDYLLKQGINITDSSFKNKSKKWSDRIAEICAKSGIDFSKDMESKIKREIAEIMIQHESFLTKNGQNLIDSIIKKIKVDIQTMKK